LAWRLRATCACRARSRHTTALAGRIAAGIAGPLAGRVPGACADLLAKMIINYQ
jgi:hypothetical protein